MIDPRGESPRQPDGGSSQKAEFKEIVSKVVEEVKIEGSKVAKSVHIEFRELAVPAIIVTVVTAILTVLFFLLSHDIQQINGSVSHNEKEFAEGLGGFAVNLVVIGSVYFFLRRSYEIIRGLDKSKYREVQKFSFTWYKKLRKPLLWIHNFSLAGATVVGLLHGIFLLDDDLITVYTGVFASLSMMILSTAGIIMYYRFRPVWRNRELKGFIRFVHRQWIISIFFIVFLFVHIASA